MGRSLGHAVDALLGRSSLRFAFEITPQLVADLPGGVSAASIIWEKGSLVSYTEPACVNPDTSAAMFENVLMRQTATIYKHGNALLPTFYTFKVQSVQQVAPSSSSDSSRTSAASAQSAALSGRRKTIAHAKLDLAQFCSAESTGPTTAIAIEVPLEPQGTLHLTVKTVWLQHYDQAKSAQLLQQGCATAQPWGSVSDVESCTDRSSISSSIFGSYLCETERNTCSGSAELDRLLREAEAATEAKTVPANSKAASTGCLALKPRVVTLDTLSTATAATPTAGPRGPSRQHPRTASTGHPGLFGRSSPPQNAGQAALDVLGRRSDQQTRQASPFGGVTLSVLEAGSRRSSSSGSDDRANSPSILVGSRRWHRRASSVPETPPILEADREGMDTSSFTAVVDPSAGNGANPSGCAQLQQVGPVGTAAAGVCACAGSLPFGMRPSSVASAAATDQEYTDDEDETAAWMDVCSSATAAALQPDSGHSLQDSSMHSSQQRKGASDGPETLRSLSGRMPTWLWPSSRLAVRDLTTDEIMRRISGSKDVTALQHMCRGLLCERNDWRFRATQAERVNTNLQHELHELRTAESETQQQLQQQLSEGQLVHKLVDAKLQLAQSDLSMQDLKRQLERERKRHMQALAKLTSLQDNFDRYIHEHQAGGGDCCKPVGCYV